ncbi:MAG TPA: cupredoxin family copper-binding protein [Candidatus Angelobacter sp.]|nr:cupredoxin family copper-binding protein [Candidatus Angelobacter sp.]
MRRTGFTLGFAALAIVLIMMAGRTKSFGATAVQDKPATEVKIDNFVFAPNPVTVPAGTTIRWTNRDDIPHNVVAEDKSFKSKVMDTDESFTYTFSKPGTYIYFCSIHPRMTGKVVVQ